MSLVDIWHLAPVYAVLSVRLSATSAVLSAVNGIVAWLAGDAASLAAATCFGWRRWAFSVSVRIDPLEINTWPRPSASPGVPTKLTAAQLLQQISCMRLPHALWSVATGHAVPL